MFVTEGRKLFLEAPAERLLEVYVSEDFVPDEACGEKLRQLTGNPAQSGRLPQVETVSREVFAKMSDTQTPQGILCVVRQYHYTLEELLRQAAPLLLVLEDLQDPGNVGTILRTAEGAGVSGVILSRGSVDLYHPKTVRATMGSVYRMPFLYAEDLQAVLGRLREAGVKTYAAHLQGKQEYDRYDYKGGTAFLIGNEGNGLKEATARAADCYLKIPMEGRVESLNASVAAAVLMYEASRQRRNGR